MALATQIASGGKRVLPVLIDDYKIPGFLLEKAYANLRDDGMYDREVDKLAADIKYRASGVQLSRCTGRQPLRRCPECGTLSRAVGAGERQTVGRRRRKIETRFRRKLAHRLLDQPASSARSRIGRLSHGLPLLKALTWDVARSLGSSYSTN